MGAYPSSRLIIDPFYKEFIQVLETVVKIRKYPFSSSKNLYAIISSIRSKNEKQIGSGKIRLKKKERESIIYFAKREK